jgi:probable phosphoglycerate mutase
VELVIVRHGETEWTITGRFTGTTEVPLTADGRRQVVSLHRILSGVLKGRSPVVLSSPRGRARESAGLALPDSHALVDPLLAEFDYGTYEGLTPTEVVDRRPGWNIWRDGCPEGESVEEVGVRARQFLESTVAHAPGPVVVVTHGHFSRILAATALGLAPAQGRLLASATASVSLVEDHHGERCIGLWNVSADLGDDPGAGGSRHREPGVQG